MIWVQLRHYNKVSCILWNKDKTLGWGSLKVYRFLPVDGEDAVESVLVAFPRLESRLHHKKNTVSRQNAMKWNENPTQMLH